MVKVHTTISVDDGVIKKAKDRNLNISEITENALRVHTDISEEECFNNQTQPMCGFCNKKEKWATKDDMIGMTWLCPDEMWICSSCLNKKIKEIIKKY